MNTLLEEMRRPFLSELPDLPRDQQTSRGIKVLLTGRMAVQTVLFRSGYGFMIAACYFAANVAGFSATTSGLFRHALPGTGIG